ncbi:MAG: hypothetical protein IKW90_14730 [Lachnospiraceae bacterium]|nr:hypothetical protein [Lachnospiraceae bacterium]
MRNGEPKLDYEKMMEIRSLYEQGVEPEPGSPEAEVFWVVKAAAEYLRLVEREEYIQCLWCPNRFISVEDDNRNYNSDVYENCEEDCAGSYYETSIMCGNYMDALSDYYQIE